jgi:hypothetical protein
MTNIGTTVKDQFSLPIEADKLYLRINFVFVDKLYLQIDLYLSRYVSTLGDSSHAVLSNT